MAYAVSFSELKTWRTCRMLHHYKYHERLEPKMKPVALKRGAWIHALLEAYYKGNDWREVHRALSDEVAMLMDEEREYYGDLPGTAETPMTLYEETYPNDRTLAVELECKGLPLSKTVHLNGRIDLVLEDSRGVWVVEHKTVSRMPSEDERIVNPQVALYIPVVEQQLGVKVSGVLWNYLITRIPKRKQKDLLHRRYLPINKNVLSRLREESTVAAVEIHHLTRPYRSLNPMLCRTCSYRSLCIGELMGLDVEFIKRAEYRERGQRDHSDEGEEDGEIE